MEKEIRSCVVEIIILVFTIVVTYFIMMTRQAQAKQMCNISSYEAYMNTKPWCDIIDWQDVRNPYAELAQ